MASVQSNMNKMRQTRKKKLIRYTIHLPSRLIAKFEWQG